MVKGVAKCKLALYVVFMGCVLSGCEQDSSLYANSQSTAGVRTNLNLISTVLGCSIYRVSFEGSTPDMYITVCNSTKTADLSYMIGKSKENILSIPSTNDSSIIGTFSPQVTPDVKSINNALDFSTSEKKVLEQADKIRKKYEVLDKLSEEDKSLLGFQVTQQAPTN